jgi:hypothetical protein
MQLCRALGQGTLSLEAGVKIRIVKFPTRQGDAVAVIKVVAGRSPHASAKALRRTRARAPTRAG